MWTIVNDELYHYGVLGMRWGVRRAKRNVKQAQERLDELQQAMPPKRVPSGKKYAKRALHDALAGVAIGAAVSHTFRASPKRTVRNMLRGALGGVTVTAIRASNREWNQEE